jgi:hypothetical protein
MLPTQTIWTIYAGCLCHGETHFMDYFTQTESDAMLVMLMDEFDYIHDPVCTLRNDIFGMTLKKAEDECEEEMDLD